MNEWFEKGIREAVGSTLGWAAVMIATLVAGFCAGYWIGHREFTGPAQTLTAFVQVPYLWLGFRQILLAYIVTALAWYLPLRCDFPWLRTGAASANFLTWLVVIQWIVVQTANEKLFRY